MNFFFLTRCYQPGNIQRIKDNFAGSGHGYRQCLVTKGETMKRVGLKDCLNPPRCEDGIFFSKLLACGHYHIKWVDEVLAYYNKMPRLG